MSPNSKPSKQEVASDGTRQKLIEILQDNGISEEVDQIIITEPEELKGEHFAAASVYARIDFKNTSVPSKNLFIKQFTTNALHIEMSKQMRIMEKESVFFNKFLPTVQKFCKNYSGCENLIHFFPKCLYSNEEMIVLENLVLDDSFIMLDKEVRQDLFTAKYVLSNLAKFHAATFALIEETGRESFKINWEPVIFEAFMGNTNPMMESMFDNGAVTCMNILKGHPVKGDQEALQTLVGFMGKMYPEMCDLLKNSQNEKLIVVNHGDCWNNNMLFKKDSETGEVNDHIFVDLQITRLGSPNLDLGYFLHTSVQPEIRRHHLKELLQHYFEEFEKTAEKFQKKCPITFEEFYMSYKQHFKFGFFINLTMLTAIGAMKEIDMENLGEDPEEMMAAFTTAIDNWIKKNPEQSANIAVEIVASIQEFSDLMK